MLTSHLLGAKKRHPHGRRRAGEENGCCQVAAFLLLVIGLPLLNGELGLPLSSVVKLRDTSNSEMLHPQYYLVLYEELHLEWQSPEITWKKTHYQSCWNHPCVHTDHITFQIQTCYCQLTDLWDLIQISSFFMSSILTWKREFAILCKTSCINPSHMRPKPAHEKEET